MQTTYQVPVDGAVLHVQRTGTGPALLAIGGAGAGVSSYRQLAPLMGRRYAFICYDRRGMDASTGRTDTDLDVAQQTDDIVAVLEHLGAAPAAVFATCAGAALAFDLLARFPHLVTTMVVHEPFLVHELPDAAGQIAIVEGIRDTHRREGPAAALMRWTRFVGQDNDGEISDVLRERAARHGDYVLRHEVMPMVTYRPDHGALVGKPLVLAAGDGSLAAGFGYARTAPLLAARLGCPMVLFPGNHTAYHYRADEFAAALTAALG